MSCSIQTTSGKGLNLNLDGTDDVSVNLIDNTKGGSMAGRSGPVVINISINDDEGVFKTVGDGLLVEGVSVPEDYKRIVVNAGGGLGFAADPDPTIKNKKLVVAAGAGITYDTASKLTLALGDGLKINANNQVEAKIGDGLAFTGDGTIVADYATPSIGPGLVLGANGDIEARIGDGIVFAPDGSITAVQQVPSVGAGLDINNANQVEVHAGAGLTFALDNSLIPNIGTGLSIDTNGHMIVDNTQPGVSSTFTVMTDSQFSFKDSVLYIAKVFTTYTVSKSASGAVTSIDATSTRVETDAVTISGGYGLPFGPAMPNRIEDPKKPNFYKS